MNALSSCIPQDRDMLIYVPSIALGPLTRRHLIGLDFFQERNYYLLELLKDPDKHLVFVLSDAMEETLFHAHQNLIRQTCKLGEGFSSRVWTIKVQHHRDQSLSKALMADDGAMAQLRQLISCHRAILDFWAIGADEAQLSRTLGLDHIGLPFSLIGIDNKASGKDVFRRAGQCAPSDFGLTFSFQDLWNKQRLFRKNLQSNTTLLLKLNLEEGGNGIARIANIEANYDSPEDLRDQLNIDKSYISVAEYEAEMASQGALAELYIADGVIASPSAKMVIDPLGQVHMLATHDQILSGSTYQGCRYPANRAWRKEVERSALKIGTVCAQDGWRGIVSVDFLLTGQSLDDDRLPNQNPRLNAIEINARKCATTHPFYWSQTLNQAVADPGKLADKNGRTGSVYETSEYIKVPATLGLKSGDVLRRLDAADLSYCANRGTGVLVHMLSSLRQYEKIGVTAIADNHMQTGHLLNSVQKLFLD